MKFKDRFMNILLFKIYLIFLIVILTVCEKIATVDLTLTLFLPQSQISIKLMNIVI